MENDYAEFFEYIIDKTHPYDSYERALDAELARDGVPDERRDALLDRYAAVTDKKADFTLAVVAVVLFTVVIATPAVGVARVVIRNAA